MPIDYEKYAVRSPMREPGTPGFMTYMSGLQVPGVQYYIEFGWVTGVPGLETDRNVAREFIHKKHDEIILFIGDDPDSPENLGADLEFPLGGQPLRFNTTSALFIPEGVRHGPVKYLEYRKPHIVISILCGAGTLEEAG